MARLMDLASSTAVALAATAAVVLAPAHPSAPVPWEPVPAGFAAPAPARAVGSIAVKAALTRLGDPYVWAAAGPDAFDCSGLVVWSFQQAGMSLPHSSQALAAGGQPVPLEQMQPGDVITYYSDASHVGLYVGGDRMVHASTYGVPVAVVPVDNAPIYNVRRYR